MIVGRRSLAWPTRAGRMFSRSLQAAEEYYRASLGLLLVLQGLDASVVVP